MARRNEKHFFSQLITQRGAEKTTEQRRLRSKSKISPSDNKTAQVPSCQSLGLSGSAVESSWPGLEPPDLGHPNFQLWRNTVTDVPQRDSGQTMRQPSYNSKKHQSAQERVLYERLGVFSLFQTDLLRYKWVRGGGAADSKVRRTACCLPAFSHNTHSQAWRGGSGRVLLSYLCCLCPA